MPFRNAQTISGLRPGSVMIKVSNLRGAAPKSTEWFRKGRALPHIRRHSRSPFSHSSWVSPSIFTVLIILGLFSAWAFTPARHLGTSASLANAGLIDQRLQQAARRALGDRRGTVIVMDPQTGRIRAVVNPQLAYEESLPPGSTIKPFTALAALRSGVIDEDTRTLCHENYSHDQFHTICSHPRDLSPLSPTDALAYSCNYYFGKVGERLAAADLTSTLEQFGFGRATGINAARESKGFLRRNDWHTENAMGEGDYLRATPIQLLNAYSSLVNGGHLFTPRMAAAASFVAKLQGNIGIENEQRQIILKGMRGAVRYGTAESAKLYSLPIHVFGKTGTATEIDGYRSQGWFVGFVASSDEDAGDAAAAAPDKVKLAVLVFLARGHGSDAAELARPIFDEYSRVAIETGGDTFAMGQHGEDNREAPSFRVHASPRPVVSESSVRVHLVSENITRAMPLEDYVRGVVAVEGSLEREPEALKALAVASRTYVLKNLGRHARDGYDFCTTTHCQRFQAASAADFSAAVVAAVDATRGEVLSDNDDQVADAYFSASCGGATANKGTLWGGTTPPYLKGVRDEYCATEAHHNWSDVISQVQLLKALKTDPRTNVGERLASLTILRTDASGRAELIAIEGDRRVTVSGWDFKIIVGRVLGWNLLKSSRFEVSRSGSNFIFRGSGFGHGLGLCQEGAHVMASRGASYRQILAKYFPATRVTDEFRRQLSADLMWGYDVTQISPRDLGSAAHHSAVDQDLRASRKTLASENFRINYPSTIDQREVEALLSFLQLNRKSLIARVAVARVSVQFPALEIFINETTGDFVGRTGLPYWAAAATRGNQIELQPLAALRRRRILETTLRHELVHTMVDIVSRERAPRWLAEGLAIHIAGEGPLVARYEPRRRMTIEQINRQLGYSQSMMSAEDMRTLYAAAYGQVRRLIQTEGEASVWRRVAKSGPLVGGQ
jgi:SpoIID/LytB domain protein